MTSVSDIINELESIAPPELAVTDDRIGLQAGQLTSEVRKVFVTVDATDAVVETAIEQDADIIVAHHPLIFKPLTSVAETAPVQRRLARLIRANAALYVLHTNYDTVRGGINDVLADTIGVRDTEPLVTLKTDSFVKIAVFVPEANVEDVRNAMSDAGAGMIGRYTHCSFRSRGIGSFVPLCAADPYIGSIGNLEEVEEYRLEMVCAASWADLVVEAMLEAHPYDEVGYDLYELANEPIAYGYGRVGILDEEMSLSEFAKRVKDVLELEYARITGDKDKRVRRVALCGGSGSGQYKEALKAGADVYVTGDTKYHDVMDAKDLGLAIVDAGHFETERPGMVALAERLGKMFADRAIDVRYVE